MSSVGRGLDATQAGAPPTWSAVWTNEDDWLMSLLGVTISVQITSLSPVTWVSLGTACQVSGQTK